MSRLLKEIRFGDGVKFTFEGQEIVIKAKRSNQSDNAVKLTIEAPLAVRIEGISGITRQDG
jgi:hypothetical protein